MSNEKFTQGEWTAHLGIMEPTFVHIGKEEDYIDGETPVIAELYHGIKKKYPGTECMYMDDSEQKANAALIAAAPQMYALLKLMTEPTFMGATIPQYLKSAIEAVLKKARGEE